jgi:hypothetical protein
LRESRMVVERLCQAVGLPDGLLRSVTECGVYSAAMGLSGYGGLERQLDLLGPGIASNVAVREADGGGVLDGGCQHAWLVAEAALDLLVATYRAAGAAELTIVNIAEPQELKVIGGLVERHGLSATIEFNSKGAAVVRLGDRDPTAPTILSKILQEGIPVSTELWFRLFHRSHDALAPDTVISRTHTGSIVVKPDGTVIGKQDPEFIDMDLSMLTAESLLEPKFAGSRRKGS